MKKIVTMTLILVITVVAMGLLGGKTYAASSFKLEATPDTTSLKPGDTVTITLKVSDINVGAMGINALEGYLEYDENVFEIVTQENLAGKNGWTITYNSENGKFLGVLLASGATEPTEVGTISLKVKAGIGETSSTVKLKEIATNDGSNLVQETDKEVNLTIGQEAPPVDDPPVDNPPVDNPPVVTPPTNSSFKFNVSTDVTKLKPGEIVTVTLNVSDINLGDMGINVLEAYLEYDENIFEPVIQDDFAGLNSWTITYNSDNNKFLAVLLASGVTDAIDVGTVQLRVKSGIDDTNTTIKFKNVSTNDGMNLVEEADKSVALTVENERIVIPDPPPVKNEIVIDPPDDDNTLSPDYIPQTGSTQSIVLGTIIIAIIVLAIKLYSNYKNIDR